MRKRIEVIKKILKKTRQPPKMFYYFFSASEFDVNSKHIRKPLTRYGEFLCLSVSLISSAPLLVTTSRELKDGKRARAARPAPVKRDLNKVPFFMPKYVFYAGLG